MTDRNSGTLAWLRTFRKPTVTTVGDLANRIVTGSITNADVLRPSIHSSDDKDQTQRWFAVICEFLYFFMHLTNRFTYRELGDQQRCKVQDELYPLIVRPTIEAIFGHWPTNLKDGMEKEFTEKLNTAELEYSECKQLLDRDNPLAQDALFSKFAGNVCELLGIEKSDTNRYLDTYMKVLELALGSFDRLHLTETVRAIGEEL